jgi:hypothetical protein
MKGYKLIPLVFGVALAAAGCASNGGGAQTASKPAEAAKPATQTTAAAGATRESEKCRKYAASAERITTARDLMGMPKQDVINSAHGKVNTDVERQYFTEVITTIYDRNLDDPKAQAMMYERCLVVLDPQ